MFWIQVENFLTQTTLGKDWFFFSPTNTVWDHDLMPTPKQTNKQTKETQKKFYFPFPLSVFWQLKKKTFSEDKITFPITQTV